MATFAFCLSVLILLAVFFQYLKDSTSSTQAIVETPAVDDATAKYFKQLATFEWDFHEKYKFERNRRNFLRDRQQEMFSAATTDTQKLVLKAFQEYHWMNGKKPVLSDFAVKPVVASLG